MKNKTAYAIFPDKSLIVECYCGEFSIEELIEAKNNIACDENYSADFNLLHDIRDSKFLFRFNEIDKYVDFLFTDRKYMGERKSFVLTTSPYQVIIGLGFDMKKRNLPINVKVASTIESVVPFFELLPPDNDLIESWLETHRNKKSHRLHLE